MASGRVGREARVGRDRVARARPPTRGGRELTPEGGRRQSWTRVARSRADAIASRLSAPAAGALAAAWTAVIGLLGIGLAVVVAWVAGAGPGEIAPALKVAGLAWFAAHHVAIGVGDGAFSFEPIGLMIVPTVLLWRAGRWAARRSGACHWGDIRVMTGFAVGVYATIALVVSSVAELPDIGVAAWRALLGTGFIALVAFGAGAVRESGLWPEISSRVAPGLRRRARAAGVVLSVAGSGALVLVAASLVLRFGEARRLMTALDPGATGGVLVVLLCVLYLPNLAGCAVAYMSGIGFAVGDGMTISPVAVDGGALPALPLLAAVPSTGAGWMLIVLAIPLFAGALGARTLDDEGGVRPWSPAAWRDRAWIGGIAWVAIAMLSTLSSGSLGSGHLREFGPSPLLAAFAFAFLVTVGAVAGDLVCAAARVWRRRRGTRRGIDVRESQRRTADSGVRSDAP